MEFLLIGESKLKIVMDEAEVKTYNLDPPPLADSGNVSFRRSFWRVIDRAREEVGFDPMGDKILIQFYPMKNGGCEVFVTKLGILPDATARLVSKSNKVTMLSKKRSLYSFDTLSDLIALSREIMRISGGVSPTSDVYLSSGRYYLSIEEYGKGGEPMEFPCILEFARGLTADFGVYISEHAERLTDGDGIAKFARIGN